MSDTLNNESLLVFLIGGILLTSLKSISVAKAQPTPTALAITVSSSQLGTPFWSECTIEATLTDENGNPLQNMEIDFLYACEDHTHLLGTAKTDSNGVASLTYSFTLAYDPWRIMATFRGTTSYASSSSAYVDITIIDYTPYLVGGGLIAIAIIGVVGYRVFRRRKTVSTKPMTVKGA